MPKLVSTPAKLNSAYASQQHAKIDFEQSEVKSPSVPMNEKKELNARTTGEGLLI